MSIRQNDQLTKLPIDKVTFGRFYGYKIAGTMDQTREQWSYLGMPLPWNPNQAEQALQVPLWYGPML
jgi:hypothetical protein